MFKLFYNYEIYDTKCSYDKQTNKQKTKKTKSMIIILVLYQRCPPYPNHHHWNPLAEEVELKNHQPLLQLEVSIHLGHHLLFHIVQLLLLGSFLLSVAAFTPKTIELEHEVPNLGHQHEYKRHFQHQAFQQQHLN